ncbi:rab1a protein, partial [Cryptosporidium xiaoi]
ILFYPLNYKVNGMFFYLGGIKCVAPDYVAYLYGHVPEYACTFLKKQVVNIYMRKNL